MVDIRKIITMREMVLSELGVAAPRPVVRAVGIAVILNPFAGQSIDDLRPLFEAGEMLGERLMPDLLKLLDGAILRQGGARRGRRRDGAWGRVRPSNAREADASRDRRQGSDLL